jgi:antitoxin (DNA-binding transcriptional repressor) of toxin-antitoxin stability system
MKRVGIREFRDHATRYLAGSDVLAIERHGRPIGFYVPAAASQQETITQALERLQETVERVRAEAGLSEEELSRLYDLNEPLPDRPRHAQGDKRSETYAPRG